MSKKDKLVIPSTITGDNVLFPVFCPYCESKLKIIEDLDTDWYGNLKYYRCRNCKETFVSENGGKLKMAATD